MYEENMISNITNNLPSMLKQMSNGEAPKAIDFDLIETMKFFKSILPKKKEQEGLKHIYFDCIFELKEKYFESITSFNLSIDSIEFLKDFYYEIDSERGRILIRSNLEELAILSMILIGSIKELKPDHQNQGIFISLAQHFLTYCLNNDYEICKSEDLGILEKYNDGFDKEVFEKITFIPTDEEDVGTIHFVGIEFNKDILCIFERYKNVKFTYNEENFSFIISMRSNDWDDFWENSPQYLKDEFMVDEYSRLNLC
jgi:hypothetical protein